MERKCLKVPEESVGRVPACEACANWSQCVAKQKGLEEQGKGDKEPQRVRFWVNARTLPFFRGR